MANIDFPSVLYASAAIDEPEHGGAGDEQSLICLQRCRDASEALSGLVRGHSDRGKQRWRAMRSFAHRSDRIVAPPAQCNGKKGSRTVRTT
jgi:hypothetical protein